MELNFQLDDDMIVWGNEEHNISLLSNIPDDKVLILETAGFLLGRSNEFGAKVKFADRIIYNPKDLVYHKNYAVWITNEIQTLVDLINDYESLSGVGYEICCNIAEYYTLIDSNPTKITKSMFYDILSEKLPIHLLDSNFDDLFEFHNHG